MNTTSTSKARTLEERYVDNGCGIWADGRTNCPQVAYLLADISDVKEDEIKDIFQSLEQLSAGIRTRVLY